MKSLTPRQERFCHEFVNWVNGAVAAREAGYQAKWSRKQGSRLLATQRIRTRIRAIQVQLAGDGGGDLETLIGKLEVVYRRAIEDQHFTAAARAIELQAKLTREAAARRSRPGTGRRPGGGRGRGRETAAPSPPRASPWARWCDPGTVEMQTFADNCGPLRTVRMGFSIIWNRPWRIMRALTLPRLQGLYPSPALRSGRSTTSPTSTTPHPCPRRISGCRRWRPGPAFRLDVAIISGDCSGQF